MPDDARFRQTYLALVALNWEALERIDMLVAAGCDAWATPLAVDRLQWLRLELLQLEYSAARCSMSQRLSMEQHGLLQSMIATLLDWLDFEAVTAAEIVRLRLGAAQNWLLDEACRLSREGAGSELDRRRG